MGSRVKDKVVLITGGAFGIGAGTAKRFIEEGAFVVISDIDAEAGQRLADALGPAARFISVDVTKEEDVAGAVDFAISEFGRLDCIINNAGIIGAVGSIKDIPVEAWDQTTAILLRGVFLGMKHAARVMIPQKAGAILSMSSTAGVNGGLGPHVYSAAKHGIIGLTRSVGSELAKHGIRVNAVAPGNIATEMTSALIAGDPTQGEMAAEMIAQISPLGIAGYPVDVANALLYLASDEARYITGHTLVIDAGQTTGGVWAEMFHQQEADMIREGGKRGL